MIQRFQTIPFNSETSLRIRSRENTELSSHERKPFFGPKPLPTKSSSSVTSVVCRVNEVNLSRCARSCGRGGLGHGPRAGCLGALACRGPAARARAGRPGPHWSGILRQLWRSAGLTGSSSWQLAELAMQPCTGPAGPHCDGCSPAAGHRRVRPGQHGAMLLAGGQPGPGRSHCARHEWLHSETPPQYQ